MAAKLLRFRHEAREGVCAGLNILASAVKVTLGPKGRLVMLERSFGPPTVINSGVIVAKEIELSDPFENLGAQLAREVAAKTSETAGDGTTTATVLAQAIVNEGMKYVAAGIDPMDLKRGIDVAVDAVVTRAQRQFAALQLRPGDRPGRDDLGQRRRCDRRDDRAGDGEGRRARCHQDRGQPWHEQRARGRRGHAVRPRIPLALLHHRHRKAARRARGRVCARPRQVDLVDPRSPAAAGTDLAREPPAAADCGRCDGRGAGDARRQRAAWNPEDLRSQGAGFRRPPQGDARGHRHTDRGHGNRGGDRSEAREGDARRAGTGAPDRGRQGRHDVDRKRGGCGKDRCARGPDPRRDRRDDRAITIASSSRSGRPGSPAASR